MSYTVTYEMEPIAKILKDLGLDKDGDVQKQFTGIVNHRITKYMPFLTGVMSTKEKRIINPTTIEVATPYAHYQYMGEVWVDPITKAAGFLNANGEWRSRAKVPKIPSGRPLNQTQGNPNGGPFWDKRLVAAEGAQIVAEIQEYVKERGEKL